MSERPVLAIWGASGHAMVVADIVRLQGIYEIAGFLDDVHPERAGTEFCDALILGGREQLRLLRDKGVNHVLLGFGDCRMRFDLTRFLQEQEFLLPVAVHPRATMAKGVVMGPGTVIAAGAVVNSGSWIGSSVIINTSASVDHECIVEDAAHICPGVRLAGRVQVGRSAQVGIGATVISQVRIGSGAIVGAGSVVVRDIPDSVVAYGVPAIFKRKANP